jgi:hypothetical protein
VLYKYRGLSNLQYALDIFVNSRMHAAKFTELNDPMEGIYTYQADQLSPEARKSVLHKKTSNRILSLSETPYDMLMWTYYAEAHSGMVVGIEITENDASVQPVNYVDDLHIDTECADIARGILVKKLKVWRHEREQRAFIHNKDFIQIAVHEIIFGLKTNPETAEFIEKVARQFCPAIEVRTIARSEIDAGKRDLNV